MPDIKIPTIRNEVTLVREGISSHQAVKMGIATHAEKEKARREELRNKIETQQKLGQQNRGVS